MKKRVLSLFVLILVLLPYTCFAVTIPEHTGESKVEPTITERINVVFDNSDHEYVPNMLYQVIMMSAISENSQVWLYPIAGSAEPIIIQPTQDFINTNYTAYSKTSNEFKGENIIDVALNDLISDSSASKKKLVLYANHETYQIRKEYELYGFNNIAKRYPDITFARFYASGDSYDYSSQPNLEHMEGKDMIQMALIKNGYSSCDFIYDSVDGFIKIEKGKADKNIFIKAGVTGGKEVYAGDESYYINSAGSIQLADDTTKTLDPYISGCMIGGRKYDDYKDKKTVTGVSLSYNHISFGSRNINAFFTANGTTIDPSQEDLYIPVKNLSTIEVYYRSTPGAGICSDTATYNRSQDDKIENVFAEAEKVQEKEDKQEVTSKNFPSSSKSTETISLFENRNKKSILSTIMGIIGTIFAFLFRLVKLGIFAFIIGLIASKKFRAFIHIKILKSKFGPTFEKISIKIKTIIKEISGTAVKIKGNAEFHEKYVFISHASADLALPNNRIELVIKELEKKGVKCWISKNGIQPGQNYNAVLPEAIRHCSIFMVFISPTSAGSMEVTSEVSTAKEHKKMIIPIQIEPFELFKDFPDWSYMLKQSQKEDLFSSKSDVLNPFIDYVVKMYNEIDK